MQLQFTPGGEEDDYTGAGTLHAAGLHIDSNHQQVGTSAVSVSDHLPSRDDPVLALYDEIVSILLVCYALSFSHFCKNTATKFWSHELRRW